MSTIIDSAASGAFIFAGEWRNDGMRQIGFTRGKGHGGFVAGIYFSSKYVGESFVAAAAGVPGFYNATNFSNPRHGHGGSGFENNDCARIRGGYFVDQCILIVGKREG